MLAAKDFLKDFLEVPGSYVRWELVESLSVVP
jgi:hypothetical protein